ncbi:MAG: hypothetical protein A3A33_02290 [Candidatus Yanofskybacteria bacterium RIFCSPLOWO2_01_FULL_49_25]|uniref:FAD-binding FR-type domain-containing protein n=1 Tax=Candidatus Yanofskybacteria bacterium RIFCSPLOWO2_01_FULL_49_25 TaxID=1802701 RepID=A0A1F8GSA3_9BACT|nr:MAG: hypothetical protein A3A33_02290 [Candidatus Yanofskybacteria bacterium RIFCSPLOWO2_01_FULL_49_25]
MMKWIDNLLNRITMYRLVLYFLSALIVAGFVLSFFGVMPFSPLALVLSFTVILGTCWMTNALCARLFRVSVNVESFYITAFILALIITPIDQFKESIGFLIVASLIAMASKFIIAPYKKHIFNPAAFAVVVTAFSINQYAGWWIASPYMVPLILIGGLLVVRKVQRFDLVLSFFVVALAMIVSLNLGRGTHVFASMRGVIIDSPILFFAFIMLTEPLTTPPTRTGRIAYGAIAGFLFVPAMHIGSIYSTPELALVVGNLFSYFVSPKIRLLLTLDRIETLGDDMREFIFHTEHPLVFQAGQYLEWTVPHRHSDARGNRRYFTIASSPTEQGVRIGVKLYPKPSTFKQTLFAMSPGATVTASQLAGEFVLPRDANRKLVFIAGGIGITPFRSMIKYLIDRKEHRSIDMFYATNTEQEIAYRELFDKARDILGIKTSYVFGVRLTDAMIKSAVPDYRERLFYISGPRSMVVAFEGILKNIGIPRNRIKTDFFPGFV